MILFNWIGIGMCAVGFGIAYLANLVLIPMSEGQMMIIAGPVVSLLDVVYRLKSKDRNLFKPSKGGNIFLIPIWCWGLVWLITGLTYVFKN